MMRNGNNWFAFAGTIDEAEYHVLVAMLSVIDDINKIVMIDPAGLEQYDVELRFRKRKYLADSESAAINAIMTAFNFKSIEP